MKPKGEEQSKEKLEETIESLEDLIQESAIMEVADFVAGPEEIPDAPDIPQPRGAKEA